MKKTKIPEGTVMHIGVNLWGKKFEYSGIVVTWGKNDLRFGDSEHEHAFAQHFMDASVFANRSGALCMLSSSVDDYVSSSRLWAWSGNALMGQYIVPFKDRKAQWHKFYVCAGKRNAPGYYVWLEAGGARVIKQEPDCQQKTLRRYEIQHADCKDSAHYWARTPEVAQRMAMRHHVVTRLVYVHPGVKEIK